MELALQVLPCEVSQDITRFTPIAKHDSRKESKGKTEQWHGEEILVMLNRKQGRAPKSTLVRIISQQNELILPYSTLNSRWLSGRTLAVSSLPCNVSLVPSPAAQQDQILVIQSRLLFLPLWTSPLSCLPLTKPSLNLSSIVSLHSS
jgi:hypothetical protein